ncbi:MAG TPA: GNAT family N-acyltransferase [Vicinamibacterales bacterium]|nr:GNAT family N-acyltransferase [Vicinamibacterales bacterium]
MTPPASKTRALSKMTSDPFRVAEIPAALRRPLECALGISTLRRLYRRVQDAQSVAPGFFERGALRTLEISARVTESDLKSIPARGPVVIAANHPHGALDGLLLLDIVRRVRPDVRVLANRVVARIPELHDSCFFVDPFGGPHAAARSRAGLRAAHVWLRRGGALAVFPAGDVGHAWMDGSLVDSPWKTTFERLADATGATIVRAFIEGHNSRLFYMAGRVHPWLRTALLGRELLNRRGCTIPVRIGAHRDEVADEVARLDDRACLVESGSFRVFCATADAIPSTLREIGRLREIAFRAVGEGTGRSVDLDRFDASYVHLFAWDAEKKQVIGAYRLGRSDRIADDAGVNGLYTRTLFRYDQRLLTRLGAPALELGRSFVRTEYQKNYNALLLLWRGIGAFVAQNPQYRFLFGPVSISARYSDASRAMLVGFLRRNHLDRDLAALVEALTPARLALPSGDAVPASVDDVNRRIAASEPDGKGIPVLLRQYLKLNARLLGVNVDRNFSEALDALMIVDLLDVSPTILHRYLGKQGTAAFLAVHERARIDRAA